MKTVPVSKAHRLFHRMLREVRAGRTVVLTRRGVPVAKMAPPTEDPHRASAMEALMQRLRRQAPQGARWERDELYENSAGWGRPLSLDSSPRRA